MEPRIRIDGLSKVYRTRRGEFTALHNVSLEVGAGEIVVLLGPSGCGKTTLLRCVAGLERPDAGEISIRGELAFSSVRNLYLPPERRHLSMVFQSYALWPHMTVFDNIAFPLQNLHVGSHEIRERTTAVLQVVGLDGLAERYAGQLSGGQQQRVARAWLSQAYGSAAEETLAPALRLKTGSDGRRAHPSASAAANPAASATCCPSDRYL